MAGVKERAVLVLEDGAVAPHTQKAQPGLDDQAVAGQASVGADAGDLGDVAVQGAQIIAACIRLDFQQHRLADEGFEFDVGVGAQGVYLQAEGGNIAEARS